MAFLWDEGCADFFSEVGADGDVLEVGFGGGEAAGGGDELVKVGVDASTVRLDVVGEGVDVGGLEFGGLAVGEDVGDDVVFVGEGLEGLLVGFELAGFCFLGLFDEFHFTEEDFAELFGGVEVEFLASFAVDVGGEVIECFFEVGADGGEGFGVEGDALGFDLDEGGEEGEFDVLGDGELAAFFEAGFEEFVELVGDGVVFLSLFLRFLFGGGKEVVLGGGFFGFVTELFVFVDEFAEFDGLVAEEVFGEEVHGVALVGFEEGVGEEGVEVGASDRDVEVAEDADVVFEVVADFEGCIGEEFFEGVEDFWADFF